ncbi:DUF3231 family protein [Priestia aryabhattai]|uniref:DUF3231 family protein n=1 Tax=Priestia aryabhattai TaxID=412384 RepID=UPI003D2731CA
MCKKTTSYNSSDGKKRPLNAVELTEIFFSIERTYFLVLLCMDLLQVIKDKEIKNYIKDGMEISEKKLTFLMTFKKRRTSWDSSC